MKVINLFGGPGVGKSSIAYKVAAELKSRGANVEFVPEFAKDLVWDGRVKCLADQLYILGNQNHLLSRLNGQVEYAIMDSPILMCLAYTPGYYLPDHFKPLVKELFDTYSNYNFLVERVVPYSKVGRTQSERDAKTKCNQIKTLLLDNAVIYSTVNPIDDPVGKILSRVLT